MKNIEDFRLIEAHWANAGTAPFVVTLQIEAANSGDLLAKITSSISGLKLSIDSLNARLDKNQRAIINLGVRVQNIEQVETLLSKVEAIAEVEKVFRQ